MFDANNKDTRTMPVASFSCLGTYFTPCSRFSILNFEHVITGWDLFYNVKVTYKGKAYQGNIYLLKVKNRNTRKRCEICLKVAMKIPERQNTRMTFEHISHLFLVSIFDFEQVNISWVASEK